MTNKSIIPDPIHGRIEIPDWLIRISKEKPVRRMIVIRQLGLKAYIDYPGAIHTRYSHVLGVMHLAGKIVDMLSEFEHNKGSAEIAKNLKANKNNITAAGFLHDIGHGPFSHVADYVLKKYGNKSHEEIAFDIIKEFNEIENYGITINKVNEIITGKHNYPFINQIINGPIDADKLDYLLRDAYHVGLKYGLDLEHFIQNFRVLGADRSELHHCELGLTDNQESIVSAEIFIVIWKSMYDLVYQITNSRIAEKMMEKAMILRADDDNDFRSNFRDINKFIELNDELLFETLKSGNGISKELSQDVYYNKLYLIKYNNEIRSETFSLNDKFLTELAKNPEELADNLSKMLSKEANVHRYDIICDIVKSRIARAVNLDSYENEDGEPIELKSKSRIIDAIKEHNRIKVYIKRDLSKKIDEKFISEALVKMISSW